jgi:hypothetical protein
MAIRPTDLQLSIVNSVQQPPLSQRAEQAPALNQGLAQAQFAAQAEQRNERVAETQDLRGNKIEVGEKEPDPQADQDGQRRRQPRSTFDETVDEAAGLTDDTHLIDFKA